MNYGIFWPAAQGKYLEGGNVIGWEQDSRTSTFPGRGAGNHKRSNRGRHGTIGGPLGFVYVLCTNPILSASKTMAHAATAVIAGNSRDSRKHPPERSTGARKGSWG